MHEVIHNIGPVLETHPGPARVFGVRPTRSRFAVVSPQITTLYTSPSTSVPSSSSETSLLAISFCCLCSLIHRVIQRSSAELIRLQQTAFITVCNYLTSVDKCAHWWRLSNDAATTTYYAADNRGPFIAVVALVLVKSQSCSSVNSIPASIFTSIDIH